MRCVPEDRRKDQEDTRMSEPVDLNELRRTLLANQQRHSTLPQKASDMVLVDRGELLLAKDATDRDPRTLSEVPQDIFACNA